MLQLRPENLYEWFTEKYYDWTDTTTLRTLYLTCIRPHLEYAYQLWDPYTDKGIQALEAVQ